MHGNLLVGLGNLLNGTYVPVQKIQFDFKANRVEMCNGLYIYVQISSYFCEK